MKQRLLFALAICMAALSLTGCLKDRCGETREYWQYEQVITNINTVRTQAIVTKPAEAIQKSGKIYLYENLLLVNDIDRGIHVFDNTNPALPIPKIFIPIEGNKDLAVRNGILYADSYVDLLAINMQSLNDVKLEKRIENAFISTIWIDEQGNFTSGFKRTTIKQKMDCQRHQDQEWFMSGGVWWGSSNVDVVFPNSVGGQFGAESSGGTNGQGGSTARFTLNGHHLYIVENTRLNAYDVSTATNPNFTATTELGWGIETIYPYGQYLFIGSTTGMHIYNVNNPDVPEWESSIEHWESCDPVVVEDDIAYVTLRGGGFCGGMTNSLEVFDVKDKKNPIRLVTYPMNNPHGLSILDKKLYICDGTAGLRLFDATDWQEIPNRELATITDLQATDVIALPSHVILVGEDGLAQYDFSTPTAPKLLSRIQLHQ